MRLRFVIALAVSALIIAGMFVFASAMHTWLKQAAETGLSLSYTDRVALTVASYWNRFGWTLSLLIVALAVWIASLVPEKSGSR